MNAQGHDDLNPNDGAFWREKLCAALGISPSLDDAFVVAAHATHLKWRTAAARSMGVSPNLSDAELLKAHDRHMAVVQALKSFPIDAHEGLVRAGMPPGPAAAVRNERGAALENEAARGKLVKALINDKQNELGISYDLAWAAVRRQNPDLFEKMRQPKARS